MYEYRATVIQITDGDTLVADVQLGFRVAATITLRLAGINCPEVVGPTRAEGLAAKEFVRTLLPPGTPIRIVTYKDRKEKYGRYLADVYFANAMREETLLNTLLVETGHAAPFMPVSRDDPPKRVTTMPHDPPK